MTSHSHQFIEHYDGLMAFGLDRQTDEETLTCYLQKFSDDHLLKTLLPRLNSRDLNMLYDTINAILRKHLNHDEYHRLFMKEDEKQGL